MLHDDLDFEHIHETFRPKIQRYLIRLVGEQEVVKVWYFSGDVPGLRRCDGSSGELWLASCGCGHARMMLTPDQFSEWFTPSVLSGAASAFFDCTAFRSECAGRAVEGCGSTAHIKSENALDQFVKE